MFGKRCTHAIFSGETKIQKITLKKIIQVTGFVGFISSSLAAELSYLDEYTDEYGINTDEDNQKIIDLINGAACRMNTSEDFVYSIIQEEAAAYFSGQKSAEETAGIILNRVSNYIAENYGKKGYL